MFLTNNKKVLLGAGFLILCILLIAGVIWVRGKKPIIRWVQEPAYTEKTTGEALVNEITPITKEVCSNYTDLLERKSCFDQLRSNQSVFGHNLFQCISVDDYQKRDDCIFHIVKQRVDEEGVIKLCHRLASYKKRESCFSVVSISREKGFDEDIREEMADAPFEVKEVEDRTAAYRARRKAVAAKTTEEILDALKECRPGMALEYGSLCLKGVLHELRYQCELIQDARIKNYCISQRIFNRPTRTQSDCQRMPLEDFRKVCLAEIKTGISRFEADSDNDGKSDAGELFFATDPFNPDTDGDGIGDYDEQSKYHSNPLIADTDGDGLSDAREIELGTEVRQIDTDGDGLLDGEDEDPLNLARDNDGDRLSNEEEIQYGTDPNKKDTDGDGISDWHEARNATNPLGEGYLHDTDGDGLLDIDERFYLTDVTNPDTDGDGVSDYIEIVSLTNPFGAGDMDFDGDGVSDKNEILYGLNPGNRDSDQDGISDLEEFRSGQLVEDRTSDTDYDGLTDYEEVFELGTHPFLADTDRDGYSDKMEADSGNDPLR